MVAREDFDVWDLCPDCRGSGRYTGLQFSDTCSNCEGAGWVPKGDGWGLVKAFQMGVKIVNTD